jgi:WD40 repeat protein
LLISGAAAFLWAKRPIVADAIAWEEGAKVSDHTLRLEKIRTLQHSSFVLGVGWAPDGHDLATYCDSGQLITLWNSDGARLKELVRREGGPDYGNSFVFLSNGKLLLTAAAHSSRADWRLAFNLWDVDTGAVIRSIDGPEPDKFPQYNMPVAFAASADGQSVAFTSNQQNAPVNVYSTHDWSLVRRIPIDFASNRFGAAMSVARSPEGGLLAIGRTGTTVRLVDLRDPEAAPEVLHVYDGDHAVGIVSLAFSPDGRFLATGSGAINGRQDAVEPADQALAHAPIKVWRLVDQKLTAAFPGPFTPVRQLSWSSDGRFLAAAAGDGTARVFSLGEPSDEATVVDFNAPVSSVAFSPGGYELAVASRDAITIFELKH